MGGYRDRYVLMNLGLSYVTVLWSSLVYTQFHRTTILRWLAVNLGVGMGVMLMEALAVLGWVDYSQIGRRESATETSKPNLHLHGETMPDISGWLGVPAQPIAYDFKTDGFGLRNGKGKAQPEVYCLGDSILVAALVPLAEIVTERLSVSLKVPVLNVSCTGYAPQEALARLESIEPVLSQKVVLQFIFEGNDLPDSQRWRRTHGAENQKPWRARGGTAHGRKSWPANGMGAWLLNHMHWPKAGYAKRRGGWFTHGSEAEELVHFIYDAAQTRRFASELEPLGDLLVAARDHLLDMRARYAVVFVPSKVTALWSSCRFPQDSLLSDASVAESGMAAALNARCQKEGIPFVDGTSALQAAAAAGELPYFACDTHLNGVGHRVMAGVVAAFLAGLDK